MLIANKRKPNFTEGESLYLITQFERHKDILTSKLNDSTTNKQKVELWKGICNDYNSKNPVVLRTANELKRKWKNMVGAAKKELLELRSGQLDDGIAMNSRKLSQTTERIIDILKISERNCKPSASPSSAGNVISGPDGVIVEDQTQGEEKVLIQSRGGMMSLAEESKDVKPAATSPSGASVVVTETTRDAANADRARTFSADAFTSTDEGIFEVEVDRVNQSAGGVTNAVFQDCAGPVGAVTTNSDVRQSTSTVGEGYRAFPSSQQKRMLSLPLAHVIKKKRCAEEGLAHVRMEVEKLKKEKLIMEKEKLALEKEKLLMEKEKLSLEIQFLRDQID